MALTEMLAPPLLIFVVSVMKLVMLRSLRRECLLPACEGGGSMIMARVMAPSRYRFILGARLFATICLISPLGIIPG